MTTHHSPTKGEKKNIERDSWHAIYTESEGRSSYITPYIYAQSIYMILIGARIKTHSSVPAANHSPCSSIEANAAPTTLFRLSPASLFFRSRPDDVWYPFSIRFDEPPVPDTLFRRRGESPDEPGGASGLTGDRTREPRRLAVRRRRGP
jgi:hypothetical protein